MDNTTIHIDFDYRSMPNKYKGICYIFMEAPMYHPMKYKFIMWTKQHNLIVHFKKNQGLLLEQLISNGSTKNNTII